MGAAVSSVVSIAASQILLGVALLAIVVEYRRLRAPGLWMPIAFFFAATMASWFVSGDLAEGLPQIRKFYVFAMLAAVYTAVRSPEKIRWILFGMAGAGTLSAAWSLVQFGVKWQRIAESGQPFYQSYVADRTTGFMSHWMTFSGQVMIVGLVLAAFLFFSPRWKRRLPVCGLALAILSVALVLNLTRNVWAAAAAGGLYLLWFWKRWVILLTPVVLAAGIYVAPEPVSRRITSIYRPDPTLDTNRHREVLRETGLRMIQAHPWFGVGPEQVQRRFLEFVPAEAKPIPSNWWYGHLHNIYLHYAAERGMPALAALLWILGRILFDCARGLRGLPAGRRDSRWILQGGIAVTIGIMVGGWWEVNLGTTNVLSPFLVVVACAYRQMEFVDATD